MIAILLQAFVSPGMRLAARSHFHVASALVQKQDAGNAHGQVDTETDAQSHPHPHPHSHAHLATHEHSAESQDVVYVDTQNSVPPSSQTSSRIALDIDGLLLHQDPPSVEPSTHLIFTQHSQRFRSRVEPPLERPPRIGS